LLAPRASGLSRADLQCLIERGAGGEGSAQREQAVRRVQQEGAAEPALPDVERGQDRVRLVVLDDADLVVWPVTADDLEPEPVLIRPDVGCSTRIDSSNSAFGHRATSPSGPRIFFDSAVLS
jgi:hypothetical protein